MKIFLWSIIIFFLLSLSGCNWAVLDTKGIIADQQRDLIYTTLFLMLIVVIPVLVLTFVFAFRYRESNQQTKYRPDYDHNPILEIIWWAIPIIIISILAAITWKSSHSLDPYRPLKTEQKHLEIQVVALDWKWLFIYPNEQIASLNFVQIPVNVPVKFKITSQAPMNSFWIPRLAGQIYAMEGMQTLLHIMASEEGNYEGLSSNFSGRGFYGMKFITKVSSKEDFDRWVEEVKLGQNELSAERYDELVKPSVENTVQIFSSVDEGLFMSIMMKYMMPTDDSHDSHHHH